MFAIATDAGRTTADPRRRAAQASSRFGRLLWRALGLLALSFATLASAATAPTPARVVAKSPSYRLVGLLNGDTLTLRVSRALDGAPVTDAAVTVEFRGRSYPATATVDGGYSVRTPQLAVSGPTAFAFEIRAGRSTQTLRGVLTGFPKTRSGHGRVRQLGWWILNFSVCIGFLALLSRRRKRADS
ncbi:MAG: hypothetical protein KGL36_07000 [Gammaproteobacteria bacterium]|nr:hypothetical protein [Gammaproteobacteria bacterium]